jgi:hypothetical protein
MIIDKRLQVSSQQALSGAGAAPSADVIDLGSQRLIGPGDPMWWVIVARVALAGTTPTLDIAVQTDDASTSPRRRRSCPIRSSRPPRSPSARASSSRWLSATSASCV